MFLSFLKWSEDGIVSQAMTSSTDPQSDLFIKTKHESVFTETEIVYKVSCFLKQRKYTVNIITCTTTCKLVLNRGDFSIC